jgi:hypothetical protein
VVVEEFLVADDQSFQVAVETLGASLLRFGTSPVFTYKPPLPRLLPIGRGAASVRLHFVFPRIPLVEDVQVLTASVRDVLLDRLDEISFAPDRNVTCLENSD